MEGSMRSLLAAHDNAVLQIAILDREMHSVMVKMVKQLDEGHIVHGMQLAQRRCIMEGVRQMFELYREAKWRQVQQAMRTTVHQMAAEAAEIRGTDDDREVLEERWEADQEAWQTSSDHHLQQMMREAREIRGSDDEEDEGSWSDDSNCSEIEWSGDGHLQQMLQEAREIQGSDDESSEDRWSDDSNCSDTQLLGDNNLQLMLPEACRVHDNNVSEDDFNRSDEQQMSREPWSSTDVQYLLSDGSGNIDIIDEDVSEAEATFADSSEASFAESRTDASFSEASDNSLNSHDSDATAEHEVDYLSDGSEESDYVPMLQGSRQEQYTKTIIRGLVLESCELHRHA